MEAVHICLHVSFFFFVVVFVSQVWILQLSTFVWICSKFVFFPQHLVEGLLNFRRRVCRSFWLDLAFQDPPGKTDQ